MKKRKYFKAITIASLMLLTGILFWAWLFSSPLKSRLTLEAGDWELTGREFLRLGIPGLNYHLLTDLTAIDTHVPGDYPVQFLVNGRTQVCLLRIRDTRPPVATIQDVTIPVGAPLQLKDFLASLEEETALVLRLYPLPEDTTSGKNTTSQKEAISQTKPLAEENLPFQNDFPSEPNASSASQNAPAKAISELSPGSYSLLLHFTDAGGNESQYPVSLTVCGVQASCQAELGDETFSASHYQFSEAEISSYSSADSRFFPRSDELSYQTDITPLLSQAGVHQITLKANGMTVPVELIVADTTAPKVTKKKLSLWLGETAKPKDFTKKITDASSVSVRFVKKPDFKKTGKQTVELIAEDEFGNETAFHSQLTIKKDKTGPEILGTRDLSFPIGVTIAYRKSVFAVDNKDGEVSYQVDSSQVNPGKTGRYPVTYFAADSSGNESSVTVYLTITKALSITEEEVYALADEVLAEVFRLAGLNQAVGAKEKTNTNGATTSYHPGKDTALDYQVLYALYDWCRSSLHYSGTSDKSSSLQAAYDGFLTRSGDCFTYSSVLDLLLTRAGFESMEVRRSRTDTFHTWNLVRYQGAWYHLDACPLLSGEAFVPFLVNDADLLEFSEGYGIRHPDKSHQNYYQFEQKLYPERGEHSIEPPK